MFYSLSMTLTRCVLDFAKYYYGHVSVCFIQMKGKLWKEAQDALRKISDYATINQTAKIEIMFLNNANRMEATKVNMFHCLLFSTN